VEVPLRGEPAVHVNLGLDLPEPVIREDEDGVRRRKSVRGNTVSGEIEQLNTVVIEEGSKSVDELLNEEDEE